MVQEAHLRGDDHGGELGENERVLLTFLSHLSYTEVAYILREREKGREYLVEMREGRIYFS